MKHYKFISQIAGIVLFISISFYGNTQVNVDSIFECLDTLKNDPDGIQFLNDNAKKHIKLNPDAAKSLAEKALKLSKETGNTKGLIKALLNLANANFSQGNIDTSMQYYQSILEYENSGDNLSEYLILAYYGIGKVYDRFGENKKAIEFFELAMNSYPNEISNKLYHKILNQKGTSQLGLGNYAEANSCLIEVLKYTDTCKDDNLRVIVLTNLGIVSRNLMLYDKAIDYYNQALDYSKIIGDTLGIANLYQNKASLYSDQTDYIKSLEFNLLAKAIYENNSKFGLDYAIVLNNIGLNYAEMFILDTALNYFEQSMKVSESLDDYFGVADTKLNIGAILLEQKKFDKALELILEGINVARETGNLDLAAGGYRLLVRYYEKNNNYKEAFQMQIIFQSFIDSIYDVEKVKIVNELQTQYETEKKEQQIELLEKEKALSHIEIKQNAQQRNWLMGFFAILLIIAFIIFYYYRKTKAAKTKIETLQREIHHRVKNNLSIIKRLVEVTQETIKDAKGQASLNDLSNRIASMAQVHSQLYQKEDISSIDFKQYVNALCENIKSSFNRENLKIDQRIENNLDIRFSKAIPLGLIVNELLTNAYKYAENGETGTKVSISIRKNTNKLVLLISDNGRGFPEKIDIHKVDSYGLKLVNGLVQQLNGQLMISNNGGANVEIEIPG